MVGSQANPSTPESHRNMLLASSPAFSKDVGLIITFIGIGIVANLLIVYAVGVVLAERRQNQERAERFRQSRVRS